MKRKSLLVCLTAAALCTPALAEDPIQIGDVVLGLSNTNANRSMREVRGGRHYRLPGSFPGTGLAPVGAWTGQPFMQSVEFDNANGLSHNARGNLMALNFGTAATGGTVHVFSTNGSDQSSTALFSFTAANTGELVAQRSAGLAISPDNSHICGTFFESGRLWLLDYADSDGYGTNATGVSLTNFTKSDPINTISHTFGCAFLDNDTIMFAATNIALPTLYTIDFDPGTNQFLMGTLAAVTLLTPFDNSGNSRVYDVEYQPLISPYVYVFTSLFSGSTENYVSVVDPNGWQELTRINLSTSVGTSREVAMGPDRHLYLSQFSNDVQNTTYVDVIKLDLDNDNDVDLADTLALANNSARNHSIREVPAGGGTSPDQGASFSGIDVAITAPDGVGGPEVVGACCLTAGCIAQVTPATCTFYGGTYRGDNTTCESPGGLTGPCPQPSGACCDVATGACTFVTFDACTSAGFLYYGDGATCAANACEGPGACCMLDGSCTLMRAKDCTLIADGFFQGIGTTCAAPNCPAVLPVLVAFDFDYTPPFTPMGRQISFTTLPDLSNNLPRGTFGTYTGGNSDTFGVLDRTTNVELADDSNGLFPQDTFGIFWVADTDPFFAVQDLNNTDVGGTGTGTGTATWQFDISGQSEIQIQMDMAAIGNFEATDTFNFTYSIDAGPAVPVFTSGLLTGQLVYAVTERGTRVSFPNGDPLRDPLTMNGIQLRNDLIRMRSAPIPSTGGSVLTLTLNAASDGGGEPFVFENIVIRSTAGGAGGACCCGSSCTNVANAGLCLSPGGGIPVQFVPAGNCDPFSIVTPCCRANFNRSTIPPVISSQDIFDFLAAFFSTSPAVKACADFNHNSGGPNPPNAANVTSQDIFDFLAAFFRPGGCIP